MPRTTLDTFLAHVAGAVWAIKPEKAVAVLEYLQRRMHGAELDEAGLAAVIAERNAGDHEISASTSKSAPIVGAQGGQIAVLPLFGIIGPKRTARGMSEPGGTGVQSFREDFDAVMDDQNVEAVVIDCDSPGGNVHGVDDLSAHIYSRRGEKPIKAVANHMMASAAYYIASAADEVIATRTADVGSIGVYTVHQDLSGMLEQKGVAMTLIKSGKYKAEANPWQPLSDEAREAIQADVTHAYDQFVSAVARNRAVGEDEVRNGFGQGRAMMGARAKSAGLVDRIATLEEVLAELVAAPPKANAGSSRRGFSLVHAAVQAAGAKAATVVELAAADSHHVTVPTEAPTLRLIPTAGGAAAVPHVPPASNRPHQAKELSMSEQDKAPPNGADHSEAVRAAEARMAKRHKDVSDLCALAGLSAEQTLAHLRSDVTAEQLAERLAAERRASATSLPASVPNARVTRDAADQPFESLGHQLRAIANAGAPRGAWDGAGNIDQRLHAGPSGASANVGADGGFMIRKDYSTDLFANGFNQGAILSRCHEVEIGEGADGLEVVTIDETSRATGSRWGGVQVYRRGEADTVAASKPKFGKWESRLEDMMGLAYATDRLLQDATALGNVFSTAFNEEFTFKVEDEIYRGTGAGQCLGVLEASCLVTQAAEGGQAVDTIVAANVINMWARMPFRFRANAAWFYNIEQEPQLQQMTIGSGAGIIPVWMPPGGLSGVPYATIFGRPAIPLEQASAKGDVGDLLLGDFSQYAVIRKGGVQEEESIHVRFIYGEKAFRWTTRVNGAPKHRSAITPYKGASTVSPFVTLAAR